MVSSRSVGSKTAKIMKIDIRQIWKAFLVSDRKSDNNSESIRTVSQYASPKANYSAKFA